MADKILINNICGTETTIKQNPNKNNNNNTNNLDGLDDPNDPNDPNNPNEVDVIWPNSDYHDENCLPVIGSCQVSSILSTFEQTETAPETETKNTENASFKSIPINIINQDAGDDPKKRKTHQIFKEMMYFGCILCPFVCPKDSKISDHIQSVHKTKNPNEKPQLKCPACANIFYHKLSLKSHLIYDHEVGRSDINKIVNSVVFVSALQENSKNNIGNNENNIGNNENNNGNNNIENTSIESGKNFTDYVDVAMHSFDDFAPDISDKSEDEPKQETDFINTISKNEDVTDEPDRKTNKQEESNKKTKHLKCYVSTCAVRMTELANMSYHVKSHFGKVFRCLECSANFVTWKTLQTHLWRTHTIDMELYSCDKCNYKTYSLAKLNNIHKLIHGSEKSFLCDFCGKGFKNPKQLRNHKIIHKTKLQHKHQVECNICKSTFNDKRILKIHIQSVHQKLKPFACNYCSYKAASNGDLKLHVRLHTGQKPFACDQCDYSTADHNSLRKHKSRHTNEKKYKCAHCDYACIQSSTYKTHLKTKHPGLENNHIFSCDCCQFRSVNKNKYLNHLATHKDKKDQQSKLIGMIENICDDRGKPELEFVNLKTPVLEDEQKLILPKKPRLDLANMEILQHTPTVAVISKLETVSNCIILPVDGGGTANNLQYFYNTSDVVLEIIDEKEK